VSCSSSYKPTSASWVSNGNLPLITGYTHRSIYSTHKDPEARLVAVVILLVRQAVQLKKFLIK